MNGVYKITCLVNDKIYIGQGNIKNRFCRHKNELKTRKYHNCKNWQTDYDNYGSDNFLFEIIEEVEDKALRLERETYWINYYDSVNNGYNQESKYGERFKDKKPWNKDKKLEPLSDEHRQKISLAVKIYWAKKKLSN